MKRIEKYVHQIKDELDDADDYYMEAVLAESREAKDVYKQLADAEITHAYKLHELAVKEIDRHKSEGKEVPQEMKVIWEYEHKNYIMEVEELKNKLSRI